MSLLDVSSLLESGELNTRLLKRSLKGVALLLWEEGKLPPRRSTTFSVRDVGECPRSIILRQLGVPKPPPTYEGIVRMKRGKQIERNALALYSGCGLVSHSNYRLKRTFPSFGGITVVGECDCILQHVLLVEVKSTGEENYRRWKTVGDLPQQYQDQGGLYLHLFGLQYGVFHLATRDGGDFRLLPFTRDEERAYYHLYRFAELQKLREAGVIPAHDHEGLYCSYVGEGESGSGGTPSAVGSEPESPAPQVAS